MDTNADILKTTNIYQRLNAARVEFLTRGVRKSGVNMHAEFKYFELEDIVPTATQIFTDLNCCFITSFPGDRAVGTFFAVDKPEETITVEFPQERIAEPAKFRMNEVQGLGAAITYMRRYLYCLILDIVEADELDSGKAQEPPKPAAPKPAAPKKPASDADRITIKKDLTAVDNAADELQIKGLKAALKQLKQLDPSKESFVQSVADKTKGFTAITRTNCEALINKISEMLEQYK